MRERRKGMISARTARTDRGTRIPLGVVLAGPTLLAAALVGCGEADGGAGTSVRDPATSAPSTMSTATTPGAARPRPASAGATRAAQQPPCDPGGGFPRSRVTCPAAAMVGRLVSDDAGVVRIQPLHFYVNDAEGAAYAREHGLDYPFANDYYQVDEGAAATATVDPGTVCTGIIAAGYREPLGDHVVPCRAFEAARVRGTTVAVWVDAGRLVQLSELYRP